MFVSGLYSSERVLINVTADNNPLNNTTLFIYGLACLAWRLYNMQVAIWQEEAALSWKTDGKTRK